METIQWLEASMIVLAALGLSAVCIKYRRGKSDYLCGDCRFNDDSLCYKAGRPKVMICTSYRTAAVEAGIKAGIEAGIEAANLQPDD
jgi:predicted nucleic acid binding AN1-type Zn finger protein